MTVHRLAPAVVQHSISDPKIVSWRRRRLSEAGFPFVLADRLAATPGVDLHALLDLVNRGCPPELADRILAPLADAEQTT